MNYYDDAVVLDGLAEHHRDPMTLVETRQAYGAELLLDLFGCDPRTIGSGERIAAYAVELCDVIGMKRFGDPVVPYFGLADPKTAGYSLVQLIETSLVSAHFSTAWHDFAAVNVHSCMPFDVPRVVEFSVGFFGAARRSFQVLARGVAPEPGR